MYQLYIATKTNDDFFKKQFFKEVGGLVKIQPGKVFEFANGINIRPSIITKLKLKDGMNFKGNAVKTYDKEKNI